MSRRWSVIAVQRSSTIGREPGSGASAIAHRVLASPAAGLPATGLKAAADASAASSRARSAGSETRIATASPGAGVGVAVAVAVGAGAGAGGGVAGGSAVAAGEGVAIGVAVAASAAGGGVPPGRPLQAPRPTAADSASASHAGNDSARRSRVLIPLGPSIGIPRSRPHSQDARAGLRVPAGRERRWRRLGVRPRWRRRPNLRSQAREGSHLGGSVPGSLALWSRSAPRAPPIARAAGPGPARCDRGWCGPQRPGRRTRGGRSSVARRRRHGSRSDGSDSRLADRA